MIVLSCDGIGWAYGTDVIIEEITFSVEKGDRLGIVGVNGAGKSTLLKIIEGSMEATSGQVYRAKDTTLAMLDQNAAADGEGSMEEMMLACYAPLIAAEKRLEQLQKDMENGVSHAAKEYTMLLERFTKDGGFEFRGRCKSILRSLGFGDEMHGMSVSLLSGGQKTRLALARVLYARPDILILDEPTNHLDTDTLFWLEDHLSQYPGTVITVSHDRYFLDRVTSKILDIENKHGKLYGGNYSTFQEKKKKDREVQEKHYRNQQKEIARIEAYIEQQRRWNRERNIIAAESRQKMLDKMERVERPENAPRTATLSFHRGMESGNEVLTLQNLSKAYGKKQLFAGLSTLVKKKDRLFVLGPNGCGKSTLLKILTGSLLQDEGKYEFGYNVTLGYYDQENQRLNPTDTVLDSLWDEYSHMTMTEIRTALAAFGFSGDDVGKTVSVLSGGERARLTLCRLSLSECNLLILDEPTNHLDIPTREVLEEALSLYDGTMIVVSHDRYLVKKLATRILDFHYPKDGAPLDFMGGYEDCLAYGKKYLAAKSDGEIAPTAVQSGKEQYLESKRQRSEAKKLERRIKLNAEETEKIETRLSEIEEEEAASATDHVKLMALSEEKETLELRLLELYEEMEELTMT
ncbi:MAG: ABC-F family ATP-binding cassette domain-containing protein [Ruminococcaceae bacterium]|nr:ABC-F family ATP-binding cassette domain-containing protein [Oscillospiraceae bacterium]